jgi:hypothetical protein
MNEKSTAKPKGESRPRYDRKLSHEYRPSEALFITYGLLTTNENAQSVHLQSQCRHCRRQTSGTLPSSTTSDGGGLFTAISFETSFQSCCKIWICRVDFIYGSCMMVLQHIFFLQFGNFLTTTATRWTCIMASSFSLFQSLTFSSSETSAVYRLCYSSQRKPELVPTDTEWIWDYSCATWNYPSSQANAFHTCNFRCWNWRWTLIIFWPVFVQYFVLILWCRFTLKYVWPWIFHSFCIFWHWKEKQPCPKRSTYTVLQAYKMMGVVFVCMNSYITGMRG